MKAIRAIKAYNFFFIMLFVSANSLSNQMENDNKLFEKATGLFQSGKVPEAVLIFRKLSDKNNNEASFYLGKIYYHGDGSDVNKPLAFQYFKRASSNGHQPSLFMLALFYVDRCFDFESCNEANKYFEESTKGLLTVY